MRQGRQQLAEELKQRGISAKEITRAQLLLEEMFFRFKKGVEAGADFSIRIILRRMWGDTELRLLAKGEEYNPIPAVTEVPADEAEEDAYQLAILKANRQKMSYVRKNYSNIDDIDVSWLKPVFFFAIASQLSWLFASLYATVTTDIIYYVLTILLWLMVLRYSWNFCPVAVEQEQEQPQNIHRNPSSAIVEGVLERIVEEQQLYLVKNLTLTDLAEAMGTNRTYVSNYLSQVRGQTFYDYINQIRIEKKSVPLLREHPEYTLDYVANESGFASISTFRRAFLKLTGKTPRQFITDSTPEP